MELKLPIEIHNKFEIEVRDIKTGEIVQKGYAKNIVTNYAWTSSGILSTSSTGYANNISFGSGSGAPSPSRTTLFNWLGTKTNTEVEKVINSYPLWSYRTVSIVLTSSEFIGDTITEVGLGTSAGVNTHAMIKDSEGNLLSLGPKTNTQQITIYSTVYARILGEESITPMLHSSNPLLGTLLGASKSFSSWRWYISNDGSPTNPTNANYGTLGYMNYYTINYTAIDYPNKTLAANVLKLDSNSVNGKIKSLYLCGANPSVLGIVRFVFPNRMIPGYQFDKRQIGVGTGSQTIFNLTWDEARTDKLYKVYVDGAEIASGFTFNSGNITFDIAPADQVVITADYWVDYIPKDTDHELWIGIKFILGEGTPS